MRKRLLDPDLPPILGTFDPGGTTGWSIFLDGVLDDCGYGPWENFIRKPMFRNGVMLVEIPVAYPEPRSKVDPNDLIRTSLRAGELKNLYRNAGCTIEETTPKQWKGTIPKPKNGAVYIVERRVLAAVSEAEKALIYRSKSARAKSLDDNLVDSLGMGLKRLRRMRRKT